MDATAIRFWNGAIFLLAFVLSSAADGVQEIAVEHSSVACSLQSPL